MNASPSSQREFKNAHDVVVISPYQPRDWPALWQLRACQLAEQGIVVDIDDIVPCCPNLNSPFERDFHRIEQVYLSGRGKFWIAWITDQLVGHIGAQDMDGYIEHRRLFVRDVLRRVGIGTQLVRELITHCRAHNVPLIKLWANPAGPGRSLYRKMGFLEVDDLKKSGEIVRDTRWEIHMAVVRI